MIWYDMISFLLLSSTTTNDRSITFTCRMDSESVERRASEKLDSTAQSCYEHHPRLRIWCEDCPLGSDKSGSGWNNSSSQAWKHNFQ